MQFLECHDPQKYRKKIKGFHMAFNIRDKDFRINEESKYQYKNRISAEEIRKQAEELKKQRLQLRMEKEKLEKEKYIKDREALRKIHE